MNETWDDDDDDNEDGSSSSSSSSSSEEMVVFESSWAPPPQTKSSDKASAAEREQEEEGEDDDEKEEGQQTTDHPKTMHREAEKRQYEHEIQDNRAALEHITMIGNYHRHRDWRMKQWNRKRRRSGEYKENEQEEEEEGNNAPDEDEDEDDATTPSTRLPAHFVHGEDLRLYGTRQTPAAPWPNSLSTLVSDSQWDLEYGDQINQLEFAQTRLSGVVPSMSLVDVDVEQVEETTFAASAETEALLEASRVNSLDPDRLEVTVTAKDVPKALLLRCWQRAMDAASFSTLQPGKARTVLPTNDTASTTTDTSGTSSSFLLQERQKSVQDRCRDLPVEAVKDLDNPDNNAQQQQHKCRICSLEFESRTKLRDHVYGTEKQFACSWALIHAKQRSILLESLEQEVKSQAKTLTHLVFTRAKERLEAMSETSISGDGNRNAATRNGTESERPNKRFNWLDVLDILQESLSSSQTEEVEGKPAAASVTDTLDVHKSMAPMVLNQQVLDAVSSRLTQRYANVPY